MALKTSLDIAYKTDIARGARRDAKAIDRLSDRTQKAGRKMQTSMRNASRSFGGLKSKIIGATTAILSLSQAKAAIDADHFARELQNNLGNITDEQRHHLLTNMQYLSQKYGYGNEEMRHATASLASSTGDYDFIQDNLENIMIGARSTGTSPKVVADLLGKSIYSAGYTDSKEILRLLAQLIAISRKGAVGFSEYAPEATQINAVYADRIKFGDENALANANALTQTVQRVTGNVAESKTLIRASRRDIMANSGNVSSFIGESIFEKDNKTLKDLGYLLEKIASKSNDNPLILNKLLPGESKLAVQAFYNQDNVAFHKSLRSEQGDVAKIDKQANDLSNTTSSKLSRGGAFIQNYIFDAVDSILNYDEYKKRKEYTDEFLEKKKPQQQAKITVEIKAAPGTQGKVQGTETRGNITIHEKIGLQE